MVKKYVLGFAFNKEMNKVALIEKLKPEWQKGFLNGIGGKIEKDECPIHAMTREFEEETGYKTDSSQWNNFAVLDGDRFIVHCYMAYNIPLGKLQTKEEEEIVICDLPVENYNVIYNLNWLIPLALDGSLSVSYIHYG